eukprot:scaffold3955_cov160-Cylindrotheca_fusiformis.AAC.14
MKRRWWTLVCVLLLLTLTTIRIVLMGETHLQADASVAEPTVLPYYGKQNDDDSLQVLQTDSIMADSKHWDRSPVVVKQFKLLFFTIPKVGCTTWKLLFRRMKGRKNWKKQDGGLPHNPKLNGLDYLNRANITFAKQVMLDPTWTKAIFVRDPKQRFLSAYLDKAVGDGSKFIQQKCCRDGSKLQQTQCVENGRKSMASFLSMIHTCHDDHWALQSRRVEPKYWKYINFVGHLETMAEDGERLLRKIGAWDLYGSSGWGPYGNASMFDRLSQKSQNHFTGSESKAKNLYSPALERQVEQFYFEDYASPIFGFQKSNLTQDV